VAEQDKMERRPSASRIKSMSFYASSADYERRLDEDCPQVLEPEIVEETRVDDAVPSAAHS
jgi:hypothetical protein